MDNPQKNFSKIYDQHISRIYRFVYLRVNSKDIAQDITSETFTRAWNKFRTDNPESKVKNWAGFLYQIARNLVTDFYREKARVQIVSASYVADPAMGLEEKAFLNSEVEQIRSALAQLGQEQQEVVIWRYLDNLSIKEIALILDKPEATIRVIIHRARKALRETLT